MSIIKSLSAAAVLAAGLASSAFAADIGGTYNIAGTNLDGSKYGGTAEITVTTKNTCRIVWKTGSSESSGICMRNGPAFAAGYVLGNDVGLVIYQIMDDGTLDGIWTVADTEGVGTETLTPQ